MVSVSQVKNIDFFGFSAGRGFRRSLSSGRAGSAAAGEPEQSAEGFFEIYERLRAAGQSAEGFFEIFERLRAAGSSGQPAIHGFASKNHRNPSGLLGPASARLENLSILLRFHWNSVSYTHLTLPTICSV